MNSKFLFTILFSLAALIAEGQTTNQGKKNFNAAQTQAEQEIRKLILEVRERDTYSDDIIFASGGYPKPIVGLDNLEKARASRKAQKKSIKSHTIERVDVAASADMAYAYGTAIVSQEDGASFEVAYLKVYKKIDGEWKLTAQFIRPHKE